MHRRDITAEQFEAASKALHNAKTSPGTVPVTTGQHEVYGETILIRDETGAHIVLVQYPDLVDQWLATLSTATGSP